MTDLSKIFLQQTGLRTSTFSPSSRYHGINTRINDSQNGESVIYLSRRLIPGPEKFFVLQKHFINEGERPDLLAHQYYSDAERFWQLADANAVLDPNELTNTPGKAINITLPGGIPGNKHA